MRYLEEWLMPIALVLAVLAVPWVMALLARGLS